ncbi:hypothetical protein F4821DRAFT_248498 [Hypoxylon rubiginosum]|uniref:Uncharacterized protein n=1 Tax=Hypoxylon rubiginosum TaxID=110542 RepID=A0ACC0CN60_9PEZI|nr:hypothetical protein F4821DRAFT_248498 [Hypoxylon rubiginosum]
MKHREDTRHLYQHSQATPRGSQSGIGNQTGSTHPGSLSFESTSPTLTRDNFQKNCSDVQSNSYGFLSRLPVSRNVVTEWWHLGPYVRSFNDIFKYTGGFGDTTSDERGTSNLCAPNGNDQLDIEASDGRAFVRTD